MQGRSSYVAQDDYYRSAIPVMITQADRQEDYYDEDLMRAGPRGVQQQQPHHQNATAGPSSVSPGIEYPSFDPARVAAAKAQAMAHHQSTLSAYAPSDRSSAPPRLPPLPMGIQGRQAITNPAYAAPRFVTPHAGAVSVPMGASLSATGKPLPVPVDNFAAPPPMTRTGSEQAYAQREAFGASSAAAAGQQDGGRVAYRGDQSGAEFEDALEPEDRYSSESGGARGSGESDHSGKRFTVEDSDQYGNTGAGAGKRESDSYDRYYPGAGAAHIPSPTQDWDYGASSSKSTKRKRILVGLAVLLVLLALGLGLGLGLSSKARSENSASSNAASDRSSSSSINWFPGATSSSVNSPVPVSSSTGGLVTSPGTAAATSTGDKTQATPTTSTAPTVSIILASTATSSPAASSTTAAAAQQPQGGAQVATMYTYEVAGVATSAQVTYTIPTSYMTRTNGQYQFTQQVVLPNPAGGSVTSDVRFRVSPTVIPEGQRMAARRRHRRSSTPHNNA